MLEYCERPETERVRYEGHQTAVEEAIDVNTKRIIRRKGITQIWLEILGRNLRVADSRLRSAIVTLPGLTLWKQFQSLVGNE